MALTRRDLWLASGLVAAGLMFHAAVPRYSFPFSRPNLRVDRWTGALELVNVREPEPAGAQSEADPATKLLLAALFVGTGLLVFVLGRSRFQRAKPTPNMLPRIEGEDEAALSIRLSGLGMKIKAHWQEHRPRMVADMGASVDLYVFQTQERAKQVFADAIESGLNPDQARELQTAVWALPDEETTRNL